MASEPPKENPEHPRRIFRGAKEPHDLPSWFPPPPPWRDFTRRGQEEKGKNFRILADETGASAIFDTVDAALMLRRPLLVTGKPGTGKSTLAYAVAYELRLDEVLVWPITTKTTLQAGLYQYDAIGRLNHAALQREKWERKRLGKAADAQSGPANIPAHHVDAPARAGRGTQGIARFLRLGPLGTALLPSDAEIPPDKRAVVTEGEGVATGQAPRRRRPRVLLIDEIDKGEIDLPNDLLHVFERGWYEIPELSRLPVRDRHEWAKLRTADEVERHAWVRRGEVCCDEFPLVIMTSNGEREFPPAFLRRCLRLEIPQPTPEQLCAIVDARLQDAANLNEEVQRLIDEYYKLREGLAGDGRKRELAVDQLLNAVYLLVEGVDLAPLKEALWRTLTGVS